MSLEACQHTAIIMSQNIHLYSLPSLPGDLLILLPKLQMSKRLNHHVSVQGRDNIIQLNNNVRKLNYTELNVRSRFCHFCILQQIIEHSDTIRIREFDSLCLNHPLKLGIKVFED